MKRIRENDWLLIGKEEIRTYLLGPSDHKLKKWLELGMPVYVECGEWVAHADNIEEFFKALTRRRARDVE